MFSDPFDKMPKNNETIAEMHARHKKESSASNVIGIIVVCMILAPWLVVLAVDAMDQAFK